MFTIQQIKDAHAKVKSGADFSNYVQDLIELGVSAYSTFVRDGHTDYDGENDFHTQTSAKYADLDVADNADIERFIQYLVMHQQGQTDYLTFCRQSAETGVEKWIADLRKMTCTYYDKAGNEMLAEQIPVAAKK